MKKHTFLTSLVAISMSCAAHAATTDVTFGGDYTKADGTSGNVATALAATTYSYTASDGSTVSGTAYNTDPDLTKFTYTAPGGSTANLSSDVPQQSAYVGESTATGDISTTQAIVSGAEMNRENYSYVNGAGETVTLGNAAQSFTTTVELGNGQTITVVDGTPSTTTIDPTTYSFTYTSNLGEEVTLFLNDAGDGFKRADGTDATINPSETQGVEKGAALIARYNSDTAALTTAIDNTQDAANSEATLFAAANQVFLDDSAIVEGLNTDFATIATAQNLLSRAQVAQQTAATAYAADDTLLTAATDIYNAPIVDTIAAGANNAIDSALADGGVIKVALDTKQDALTGDKLAAVESGITAEKVTQIETNKSDIATNAGKIADNATEIESIKNSDVMQSGINASKVAQIETNKSNIATNAGKIADNATEIESIKNSDVMQSGINASKVAQIETNKSDIATNAGKISANELAIAANTQAISDGDALTLENAKSYADTQDVLMLNQAMAYADAQNTIALKSANDYTDHKVSALEKEVSAGIASATALSSVAVSNVGKGEVSVGGGYGYYNSQSAIALGAAMGLTDNWSVNAGAGLSDGNVAFRAGTNYKFKLF